MFTVPAENVTKAQAKGLRLETSEEAQARQTENKYGHFLATAGVAGGLRALSFGLSDVSLRAQGVPAEELRGIREANPFATLGGELVGTAAGLALPVSGPAQAARLGAGVSTRLGGGIAAKAAGTAAEGTLYGLGVFVSEEALSDKPDLLAEKLFAATAGGGVVGGALGGVFGLAGAGLRKVGGALLSALGGRGFKQALDEIADRHTARAVGFIQSDYTRMMEGRADQIGADLRRMGAVPSLLASAADIRPRLKVLMKGKGGEIGTVLGYADEITEGARAKQIVGERKEAFRALQAGEADSVRMLRDSLETRAAEDAAARGSWRNTQAADLQRELLRIRDLAAGKGPAEVAKLRETFVAHPDLYGPGSLLPDSEEVGVLFALRKRGDREVWKALEEILGRMERKKFGSFNRETLEGLGGLPVKERQRVINEIVAAAEKDQIPAPPFAEGVGFDMRAFVVAARSRILGELAEPEFASLRGRVLKLLKGYEVKAGEGVSFKEAAAAKKRLQNAVGKFVDTPQTKKFYVSLQGILDDEIERQLAATIGADLLGTYKGLKWDYGAVREALRANLKAIRRAEGNRSLSLSDTLAGLGGLSIGLATGHPMGPLLAVGAAGINKLSRERGSSLIAATAAKLSGSRIFERIAHGLHKTISGGLAASPIWGGAFRATLERAVADGAMETLATHVRLAREDPAYLAAVGMEQEDAERANAYAERADQLEQVAIMIEEHDRMIDRAIGRFFGTQSGPMPKYDLGDLRTKLDAIQAAAQDLSASAEAMIPPGVSRLAPGFSAMATATGIRALQFLAAVAPQPPRREVFGALSDPWEPGRAEMARWGRYVEAIEYPQKVLADLRNGTVTQEQVDALRAVYPKLLADIQRRMLERLAAWDERLSYPQRIALSRLLGSPIGGAGDPQRRALIQQARAGTVDQQRGGSVDGRQVVSAAKNMETQAQRIEARGAA